MDIEEASEPLCFLVYFRFITREAIDNVKLYRGAQKYGTHECIRIFEQRPSTDIFRIQPTCNIQCVASYYLKIRCVSHECQIHLTECQDSERKWRREGVYTFYGSYSVYQFSKIFSLWTFVKLSEHSAVLCLLIVCVTVLRGGLISHCAVGLR
jgi:hypothetical protein